MISGNCNFSVSIYFKDQETEGIKSVIWASGEPSKSKECSVLRTSLWHSELCESREYFVCIGKKIYVQLEKPFTCSNDKRVRNLIVQ